VHGFPGAEACNQLVFRKNRFENSSGTVAETGSGLCGCCGHFGWDLLPRRAAETGRFLRRAAEVLRDFADEFSDSGSCRFRRGDEDGFKAWLELAVISAICSHIIVGDGAMPPEGSRRSAFGRSPQGGPGYVQFPLGIAWLTSPAEFPALRAREQSDLCPVLQTANDYTVEHFFAAYVKSRGPLVTGSKEPG